MLVGLTGKYCAGKNFIAKMLENRGMPVLDVDLLGHSAIEAKKNEIAARFGGQVLNEGGSVNRRKLGAMVFGDECGLAALEAIIHPEVNRLTEQWIESQNGKTCVVNAALLHKSSAFGRLDRIIIVRAPLLVRLARARRRDGLPWAVLLKRFSSQRKFNAQYLAGNADIYKVENSCCRAGSYLGRQIDAILQK